MSNPFYIPKAQSHQYYQLRDTLHGYLADGKLNRTEKSHLRALVGDFQDDGLTTKVEKSIKTRSTWRVDNVRVSPVADYEEIQAIVSKGDSLFVGRLQVDRTPWVESDQVYEVLGAVDGLVWLRNTSGVDNVAPQNQAWFTGNPYDGVIRMTEYAYQRSFNFQF